MAAILRAIRQIKLVDDIGTYIP